MQKSRRDRANPVLSVVRYCWSADCSVSSVAAANRQNTIVREIVKFGFTYCGIIHTWQPEPHAPDLIHYVPKPMTKTTPKLHTIDPTPCIFGSWTFGGMKLGFWNRYMPCIWQVWWGHMSPMPGIAETNIYFFEQYPFWDILTKATGLNDLQLTFEVLQKPIYLPILCLRVPDSNYTIKEPKTLL